MRDNSTAAMAPGVQSVAHDISSELNDAAYDTLGAYSLLEVGAAMRSVEPNRPELDVTLVLHECGLTGAGQISHEA